MKYNLSLIALSLLTITTILNPAISAGSDLLLNRDKLGRMKSLKTPSGDKIRYSYEDGTMRVGKTVTSSKIWPIPHLNTFQLPISSKDLEQRYRKVLEDDYEHRSEELYSSGQKFESSHALTFEANNRLLGYIKKIENCAPLAYEFLIDLLDRKKVRFSPEIFDTIAAMVNFNDTDMIYIGKEWNNALEGKSNWMPLHMLDEKTPEAQENRRIYFGSSRISSKSLGGPTRAWRFVFALLHETGHLIQHSHQKFNMTVETFSIPYLQKVQLRMSISRFGMPDKRFMNEFNKIQNDFMKYKKAVESGATYFALDALAACPANL